jgi:hypothetical protein
MDLVPGKNALFPGFIVLMVEKLSFIGYNCGVGDKKRALSYWKKYKEDKK